MGIRAISHPLNDDEFLDMMALRRRLWNSEDVFGKGKGPSEANNNWNRDDDENIQDFWLGNRTA